MDPASGTYSSGTRDSYLERSVAPLVGVVLLIGLVLVAALVLAATGFTHVDQLLSETDRYQGTHCLEAFDHRATTVSSAGSVEPLPCDGLRFVDDGELYIVWHNESVTDLPDDLGKSYANTTVVGELGAVEFESGERSIAYQSGGIWEQVGEATLTHSTPTVIVDSSGNGTTTLRLELVTISGSAVDSRPASIRRDSDGTLGSSLDDARSNALDLGYGNLTLVVDSEYHDGWHSHFSAAIEDGIVSTTDIAIEDVVEDRAVQVDLVDVLQPTSSPANTKTGYAIGATDAALTLTNSPIERTDAPVERAVRRSESAGSPDTQIAIHFHELVLE